MSAPTWKAIVAADENRVIGDNGAIPWHFPEDFKWFKSCTLGQIVLMGRKTYEGLPKRPLPGRENWVLTHHNATIPHADNVRTFASLEAVRQASEGDPRTLWVCGGAELYRQTLGLCDEIFFTRIKKAARRGDAFFPSFEAEFDAPQIVRETPDFTILKYTRKA